MSPITNAIIEAGKQELTNQATTQVSNATNTLATLNGMSWPAAILLIVISLYAAFQLLKFVKWLFKMIVVVGLGALLLFLGIKAIGG